AILTAHERVRAELEARRLDLVARSRLDRREPGALGRADPVPNREVAVPEEALLEMGTEDHADVRDPLDAREVVRMTLVTRLVERLEDRLRVGVADHAELPDPVRLDQPEDLVRVERARLAEDDRAGRAERPVRAREAGHVQEGLDDARLPPPS